MPSGCGMIHRSCFATATNGSDGTATFAIDLGCSIKGSLPRSDPLNRQGESSKSPRRGLEAVS